MVVLGSGPRLAVYRIPPDEQRLRIGVVLGPERKLAIYGTAKGFKHPVRIWNGSRESKVVSQGSFLDLYEVAAKEVVSTGSTTIRATTRGKPKHRHDPYRGGEVYNFTLGRHQLVVNKREELATLQGSQLQERPQPCTRVNKLREILTSPNWTHRMRQTIVQVLDQAVSEIGGQRFVELSNQLEPANQRIAITAERINNSLCTLAKLAYRMPKYDDDWLALFYILWYQPKQINVAYRAIEAMRAARGLEDRALIGGQRLHIVDFGSGSLAMLFATALAVADALERGEGIESIQVDCVDKSETMSQLGVLILERFQQIVKQHDELKPLRHALGLMEVPRMSSKLDRQICLPLDGNSELWFSALHVVYDENIRGVMPAIRTVRELNLTAAFFTSFIGKENLVRQASEPLARPHYLSLNNCNSPGLSGVLTDTTCFRRKIVAYPSLRENLSPTSINFLKGDVNCKPQPTC